MNAYIIVEGEQTELSVYPAWLKILSPTLARVQQMDAITQDSYYLFCGHGIPNIYTHIVNAVRDINEVNAKGIHRYDYLMVCMDTEEETRQHILDTIKKHLKQEKVTPGGFELVVFEHKVCMETWFLGNSKIFKPNPQNRELLKYIRHYNVKENNPEEMSTIDEERFTTAQFHLRYLKRMFEERNMTYNKNNTVEVCKKDYLEELVRRYEQTGHILSFGSWYEFVRDHFSKPSV